MAERIWVTRDERWQIRPFTRLDRLLMPLVTYQPFVTYLLYWISGMARLGGGEGLDVQTVEKVRGWIPAWKAIRVLEKDIRTGRLPAVLTDRDNPILEMTHEPTNGELLVYYNQTKQK